MTRVRQERAETTRAAILDGAARAFDTAGFGSTSLSDIVESAGVTKGALYFHFASKESLANTLMAEQFDAVMPLPDDERPGVQPAIDLTHLVAHGLRTNVRLRAGIRLVIELGSFTHPEPNLYETWITSIRDNLAPAQGRGDVLPDIDVGDTAAFVVGAFTGIQLTSQVRTGREDLHARVTDMWRLLLPGLVPARRRARFDPAGSAAVRERIGLPDDGRTRASGR